MNANACQIEKVVGADIGSLCTSCAKRGDCLKEFVAQRIGDRMDTGSYQIQLLTECEDYANDGSGKTTYGSLRPRFAEATVRDLCCGCPSSREGSCRKRVDLDNLTRVSMKEGAYVHVSVIACKPAGGLHQISDPSPKASAAGEPSRK